MRLTIKLGENLTPGPSLICSADLQQRFPQYLREKVQSCLTLAWTFRAPLLQKTSPAKLVGGTLHDVLSYRATDYTYIDFCAGAGGPTPYIEQDFNRTIAKSGDSSQKSVKFVLTDIHPHIPDWTEASKKSDNLSFIAKSVDASNAPPDLVKGDGKTFRLFNLAFHHFPDDLARAILQNSLETSDGFG